MNSYINLLPIGQTPCPNPLPSISSSSPTTPCFALCLLLLPQNSNTPNTATPRRRFALFFFFPNTTIPQRCSLLSSSPTPRRRSLSNYQTTICYLPTRHHTKDKDSTLRMVDLGLGKLFFN